MTYQDVVDIIRNAASVVNPTGTFVHGRRTDASLEYDRPSPYIFLLEPLPTPINSEKQYIETLSFPIIFVKQDSPESTNQDREDIKQEMWELARTLLTQIETEDLITSNLSAPSPEIREFAATLSGFAYSLNITYPYLIECDEPPVLPPSVYLFASATAVFEGQQIELAWISYNASSVFIDNGVGNVSAVGFTTVTIEADTTFTATVSNSAGTDSVQISIDVVIACPDGTAQLKNSAGTLISSTPVPSGDTVDITAPDATAVLKNTLGTIVDTELIPSNVSEDIIIANVSWTDSDESVESTAYGLPIVCTPQVKTVFIKGLFESGNDTMMQLTIDADSAGTYTSTTNDGASGTITFEVNGSPASLPFTLAVNDTLDVTRTIDAADGWFKISGTYV